MIAVGASGEEAACPFSLVVTSTGLGTAGHAWNDVGGGLTDELKVRIPGGAYANATIARIVEIGGGNYEYQLTSAESVAGGKVYYYPNVALHDGDILAARFEDIVDIGAAVLRGSHYAGRTLLGAFKRLDQLACGKHTGMTGTPWILYAPDGSTVLVEAVQNVGAGSREGANTITGD